jgi:hypothetical protein
VDDDTYFALPPLSNDHANVWVSQSVQYRYPPLAATQRYTVHSISIFLYYNYKYWTIKKGEFLVSPF